MKTLFLALSAAAALAASPALAREPVPLVDLVGQPITTSSGRTPSLEEVRSAILTAASERRWALLEEPDGRLTGTLVVRRKHTVIVEVAYSEAAFSIVYRDSVNMNYRGHGARRYIHPNYNRWARDLADAIRLEVVRL